MLFNYIYVYKLTETNTGLNLQKIGCTVIWSDLQIPCQLVSFPTRTLPTHTQFPVMNVKK
jgi:hypothetical protein